MNFNPPNNQEMPPLWSRWFNDIGRLLNALSSHGTTANRPTTGLFVGRTYFDTTLGKPIWHTGSGWVDATGASV